MPNYFDTVDGQEVMQRIAVSLERLADAAEEANRLQMADLSARHGADWLGHTLTDLKGDCA